MPPPPPTPLVPKLLLLATALVLVSLSSAEGRWTRGQDEDGDEGEGEGERLLDKMVDGVERALGFFSADVSDINLDGLFGLRIGQGQIIEALRECQSYASCPPELQRRLQALRDDTDVTAQAALNYVQRTEPDYVERFLPTVSQAYVLRATPVTLTDLHLTPAGSDDIYDEEKGDRCLARMLGTYVENGKPVRQCNVTRDCWTMMTGGRHSRYSITHQLLYFILLEKQGCLKLAQNTTESNIAETEARICGSIYNEAVSEVKDGAVRMTDQDLFMEQVLLCGCLGFDNFLRADWMRMVLTWQKASGCFSNDDPAPSSASRAVLSQLEEGKQLLLDLQWEARVMESHHRGRKLQREQTMRDGCLSHKSGLGFGTLCLNTRFLVRQLFLHQ